MPELPEVEVVKKSLERKIVGLTIKKVIINNNKLRFKIINQKLLKLANKKILSIERRSKYLIINLTQKKSLLIHLGMTGKIFLDNKKDKIKNLSSFYDSKNKNSKHDHVVFFFKKNKKLIYNDVRRFGFIKVFKTRKLLENSHFKLLGPEPLTKNFNAQYFKKNILNKKKNIKNLLMDQNFVSGLGNIYVNEILYLSNIDPHRSVQKITFEELKKIIKNTKKILKESINLGGSTIKDFEYGSGRKGKFQQNFTVYNRKGLKCSEKNCIRLIKKINISQRATYYCESCQK